MAVNHPLHPAFTPSFPTSAASRRAGPDAGQGEGGATAAESWMLSRTGAHVEPQISLRI